MKRIACLMFFLLPTTFCHCQDICDDIQKMNGYVQYCLIRKERNKFIYCIHEQDTIVGVPLSEHHYRFCLNNDTCIEAQLLRKWNTIRPLWNTFFTSDTLSLLPVGDIKYVCNGDTIIHKGYKSAYIGPKFLSLHKREKPLTGFSKEE